MNRLFIYLFFKMGYRGSAFITDFPDKWCGYCLKI